MSMTLPWLPPGRTLVLPGRGEVFYRHHQHPDPSAPMLLLLHGWTASADLQFFTAYEALAEHYSFIAIDHRGHGRGLRDNIPYELHDAADDAALLVRELGVGPVITVGYSMGGPISMLLARRHPDLVRGLVVQATAMEWRHARWERWRWRLVLLVGPILRSWAYPRAMRWALARFVQPDNPMAPYGAWASAEVRRGDATNIVHAGQALSRHDARPWASALGKPAAALVTTRDHLVQPHKQYALAKALDAWVLELADDHLATVTSPAAYSAATVQLVQHVVDASTR
jgi:3-oxoadipate enol-lactonase